MPAPRLEGFLRSDRAMRWRAVLTRLVGYGTAPYPPSVQRRLRIMNVAAFLIALFTLVYTIEQVILDYQTWKPVIFINLALIAIALGAPFLHRFNEIAGALTLAISENVGLFALTFILGTDAGLHMQYFALVAGYFVVFGLGRLRLIIALIFAGLVLHLAAWAWFTQERALLHVGSYELAELYVTAVLTTSTMVAAVVYYAFRLAEQAQEQTDTLLHNILPAPIVDRLKSAPGAIIADELSDASVLFADLKGFVALAKRLGPARTVELLNTVVSASTTSPMRGTWRRSRPSVTPTWRLPVSRNPPPTMPNASAAWRLPCTRHWRALRRSRGWRWRSGSASPPVRCWRV